MTVGQSMRQCRKKKQMSQTVLAEKIGVHQMTVSNWETDRFSPSLFLLVCVADTLGVTLDELVGRTVAK